MSAWAAAEVKDLDVYLRVRNINFDFKDSLEDSELLGPLIIDTFSGSETLVLSGKSALDFSPYAPSVFAAGDIVYAAKPGADGQPSIVINPSVYADLSLRHEPFAKKTNPSKETSGVSLPPTIAGYSPKKSLRPYTIGIYDGGGTWNHNVYRPSGACRMRITGIIGTEWIEEHLFGGVMGDPILVERPVFHPFCFVCKYALVNLVDPSVLGQLDDQYPE